MSREYFEVFKILKERSKAKREENAISSTILVKEAGFEVEEKNHGLHLVVSFQGNTADFWPSTGKYIFRTKQAKGRGVFNLIKVMKRG